MAPGVSSCQYREVPLSISFSGSGFLATYQLGVAQCLLNYAPRILHTAPFVVGASAGSLVAAAVVCEMSLINIRDEMLNFAKQMKSFPLGPFNPSINVFHWLKNVLHKHLPSEAHQMASRRLAVAVTRLSDGKTSVISEFHSKEDVVQALLCSCFVPGYCGMLPPSFKGEHYMDGGFSSMQPVLPPLCSHTLTVSPFSGETDICPPDTPCMWDVVVSGTTFKGNMANSKRVINALYPLALETLEQAYHSGYKDAINFLLSNVLLGNQMMYLSMFGLPARILSNLLLPLMLAFFAVLKSSHRQAPDLVYWIWRVFRHYNFFLFNIIVCSLKKNIKDRVMPITLLLQWLKLQQEYEVPQRQRHSTPHHKLSSSAHSEDAWHGSLHRRFVTPSSNKNYREPLT
ncbi:omega-hydroxyceramide transacylase [Scomber japonicus]|uniref:omega-hydroxyceramide transacylase n=1 Tax=Scomber japonicus TaxID=13676 RepID=UPI0023057393|nr:omega-hydroxyceramide transacylase [Scomber japonicus]